MKSNYKNLGPYIEFLDSRALNHESILDLDSIRGISSISKDFIKTRANLVGVVADKYKVVESNFFAYNPNTARMGDKIPIALNQFDYPILVSSIYPTFKIKNTSELHPEYLMMWFRRPEFDRYARFMSHGSAREVFDIDEMNGIMLPIPHITKQREIVKEYNVIQNRIALNQQLLQKLEEAAKAIFTEWFVEGIDLENLPEGWRVGKIGDLLDVINGYAFSSEDFSENGNFPIIKITNIAEPNIDLLSTQYYAGEIDNRLKKCLVNQNDILISMTGSHMNQINSAVGKIGRYNYQFPSLLNQRVGKLKPKFKCDEFVFLTMLQQNVKKEILMAATGSANQANISPDTIKGVDIIIPNETILHSFEDVVSKLRNVISNHNREIRKLTQMKDLLLSKLATIEN